MRREFNLLHCAAVFCGNQSLEQRVRDLPVDLIQPGRLQARKAFDPEMLAELAESIRESGVVQPVVVRSVADGRFELLAGERRWRATQLAGLHDVPAIVRDDLSDDEAMILGLIENLQRESLTPMETAAGLRYLTDQYGLQHGETAGKIGKSRVYVSNFLRLLKLDLAVQDLVNDRKLSMGHARVLAGVASGKQLPLAKKAIAKGWSVRALEKHCAPGKPAFKRAESASEWADLEAKLTEHLGNQVHIDYKKQGGKVAGEIRVRFHSLDEFEGVVEKWGYRFD